jgi:hypothetical protein
MAAMEQPEHHRRFKPKNAPSSEDPDELSESIFFDDRKRTTRLGGSPRRVEFNGAGRDRTDDLLHAMQALSQLSYGPSG